MNGLNSRFEKQGSMRAAGRIALVCFCLPLAGCASMKKVLAVRDQTARQAPIANPFNDYYYFKEKNREDSSIILRTKKGDRAVEVEFPGNSGQITDLVIPMSPAFADKPSSAATDAYLTENAYQDRPPGISDREITRSFSQGSPEHETARAEIESSLGLQPAEDSTPVADMSYLAAIDHVKQLYKYGRYEAALLKTDELLRAYPTDPKLYEMRGTLFDRIGRPDLALNSWNQALRFDPSNQSLRRFIDRKQQQRSFAPDQTGARTPAGGVQ